MDERCPICGSPTNPYDSERWRCESIKKKNAEEIVPTNKCLIQAILRLRRDLDDLKRQVVREKNE
jgi:hypothetical protein